MTDSIGAGRPMDGERFNKDSDSAAIYDFNHQCRQRWLDLSAQIKALETSADPDPGQLQRLREQREQVANKFVDRNRNLARSAARSMTSYASPEDAADHIASAELGLWETFVGTDPTRIYDVDVDEDGIAHARSGWDPQRAKFSTISRAHMNGRVMRSVRSESANAHMSYGAFGKRPAILAARTALTTSLGRAPSYAEIAAEVPGISADLVELTLASSPASLSTPIGEDSTLEDLVADSTQDHDAMSAVLDRIDGVGLDPSMAEEVLEAVMVRTAQHCSPVDFFCLMLREGPLDENLSVVETADTLGLRRGRVSTGVKRAIAARDRSIAEIAAAQPA